MRNMQTKLPFIPFKKTEIIRFKIYIKFIIEGCKNTCEDIQVDFLGIDIVVPAVMM